MYLKQFDEWHPVKKRLQSEERHVYIRPGEIRWIAFGVNLGSEIDGKGVSFTRPGFVVHVFGSFLALVIPLSTKMKDHPGYLPFEWDGKPTAICIHQMRVVSQKRIFSRKGRISETRLLSVKRSIKDFFSL
ncbi:MAG: type II toxin-antitoxin system PemK/MazF family toxin [Patescibacteria group bacterium]